MRKIYFNVFSLSFLAVITYGCAADMFAVYGRFVGSYNKYNQTIESVNIYLERNNTSLKPYEKSAYLLLKGIAYQKKLDFAKSMECYDESLNVGYEFNYFALLQKAEIYRIENKRDDEIKFLKLALEKMHLLLPKIKDNSLSEDETAWNRKEEFIISYYINKDKTVFRQPYSTILENKILETENRIKSCEELP